MTKICVTGASAFVGHALCKALADRGLEVRGVLRSLNASKSWIVAGIEYLSVTNIGAETDWSAALSGVESVIHCADRVHVMHETESDALSAYRAVNVESTRHLAEQAVASGVRRFIFLSSIRVNGEQTDLRTSFTCDDNAIPEDLYGISKWEAEGVLHEIAARTGLEIAIIRSPLVYGPSVKGNFLSMLGWLKRGVPLPLGAIHNKRSLVGINNLVDLIITCIDHPAAANQTFLVSDGEDLSTTELLQRMGVALGKPARLLSVPASMFQLGAKLLGKKDVAQRLLGNFQVDFSKTKELLGWKPPVSVDEGLRQVVKCYLRHP